MKLARQLLFVAAMACAAGQAHAQERDARLRIVPYDADQVVAIEGHLGYQMMIEFDPRERIENVSIGDSLGWQVTPNRAATLLFLKPVEPHAATNMTVVTTRRRYAFALESSEADGPDDPRITYTLRFTYLDEPAPSASEQLLAVNFDYVSSGAQTFTPTRVFDDGRFTYFQLPDGVETPAIFVLNRQGEEEVVNTQVRGDFTVVDQIADAFVLRYGRERTIVRRGGPEAAGAPARRNGRGGWR